MIIVRSRTACCCLAVVLLAVCAQAARAQGDKPIRTIKGGALDSITLYVEKPPAIRVVIRPFSATDADLREGDKGDQTKTLQADGPRLLADRFVATLSKDGPFTDVRVAGDETTVADAIVVQGRFTELDPGSRAKRYLVGFGAGKSAVAVEGSVLGPDGHLLAEFEQRRVGVMGAFGGDSLGKLASDARSIGEDLANFLHAWATGGKLK